MKLNISNIIFVILLSFNVYTQTETLIAYDNVEDYDWEGSWWVGFDAWYFTNASVSGNISAALLGWSTSNSGIEDDIYYLPNVTGLDPFKEHVFRFRLGSYRFTGGNTAGVDSPDFVQVFLSTDGELSYTSEIRIRGYGNAYWDYNTNAAASKMADGTLTTFQPSAGGNRTNTGDGYSVIKLYIPMGVTQVAIDIYARVNASGEEWWIDDMGLYELDYNTLPVELTSFTGKNINRDNYLTWITESEINCDHYIIEKSIDGKNWNLVSTINGMGTTNDITEYEIIDRDIEHIINYYKLIQYDYDGNYKEYGPISIDNSADRPKLIKLIDELGREVTADKKGIVYEYYDDGTIIKKYKQ